MDCLSAQDYTDVTESCICGILQKGGINMNNTRKHYLDNIRWITVVLVVIYHVFYMYNAEGISGVVGRITDLEVQYVDLYQYIVYPPVSVPSCIWTAILTRSLSQAEREGC